MDVTNLPDGIMVVKRDAIWHSYRLACSCYDPKDDMSFDIEWDKELNEVTLAIESDVYTKFSSFHRFWLWEKILNACERFSIAIRVLVTGYYQTSTALTFMSQDQFDNFMTVLEWSREQVKESGRDYGEWKKNPE